MQIQQTAIEAAGRYIVKHHGLALLNIYLLRQLASSRFALLSPFRRGIVLRPRPVYRAREGSPALLLYSIDKI